MTDTQNNGWDKYQLLVMTKLDEHGQMIKEIRDDQVKTNANIVKLQTKASIWGGIAGAIGMFIMSLFKS